MMLNKFLQLMIFQFMFFADDPGLIDLGGGGDPDPSPDPDPTPNPDPTPDPGESIYGGLEVKWPENTPEEFKNDPMYKPFVDGKTGEVNLINLMKSYGTTKKSFGNKIAIPSEHATKEEWDEFYQKTQKYDADIEKYGVERGEESKISEDFFKGIKEKLHAARVPAAQATELMSYLEEQSVEVQSGLQAKQAEKIEADIKGLKTEWGAAFEDNIKVVSNLLVENASDDFKEYAKQTGLVNDVQFTKLMYQMAQELNGEATPGDTKARPSGALDPEEAQTQINAIYGDKNDPYHNRNHPSYADRQKHVQKLFAMKRG